MGRRPVSIFVSAYAAVALPVLVSVLVLATPAADAGPAEREQVSAWLAERVAAVLERRRGYDRIGDALDDAVRTLDDARVTSALRAVYRKARGRLLFSRGARLTAVGRALLRLLPDVERHGIPAGDYPLAALKAAKQRHVTTARVLLRPQSSWVPPAHGELPRRPPYPAALRDALGQTLAWAQRHLAALRAIDLALTEGLLRFLHDAEGVPWRKGAHLASEVVRVARGEETAVDALFFPTPEYRALTAALVTYLERWRRAPPPTIAADAPVVRGDRGGAIGPLRKRLAWEGFLPEAGPAVFDDAAAGALRRFQESRGLPQSGVVDGPTRAELNRPPAWWVRRLVLGLRQLRGSATRRHGGTYIRVNIPDFVIEVRLDGERRLRMPVLVGKAKTPTHEMDTVLRELRVNPRWNVPPGVQRREIDPRAVREPGFLEEQHFIVRGHGRSRRYVQEPGPWNWLGRIVFPVFNRHAIVIHGSLRDHLFGKTERAYSNGCVNLEDEIAFARVLLDWEQQPARAQLDGWLAGWKTHRVRLRKPIPVVIEYRTVVAAPEGGVRFLRDIYRKDSRALSRIRLEDFARGRPGS